MVSLLLGGEILFEPFAGVQAEGYCWGDSKNGGIATSALDKLREFNAKWYIRSGTPDQIGLSILKEGVRDYMKARRHAVGVKEVYQTAAVASALEADRVIYVTRHPSAIVQSALSMWDNNWKSIHRRVTQLEYAKEWSEIIPSAPPEMKPVAELCALVVINRRNQLLSMDKLNVECQLVNFEYTTANPAYSWPVIADYLGVNIPEGFQPTPPPLTSGKHITDNRESPLPGTWNSSSESIRTCYTISEEAARNAEALWGKGWDSIEGYRTVGW
jgi:hypothetical protein